MTFQSIKGIKCVEKIIWNNIIKSEHSKIISVLLKTYW